MSIWSKIARLFGISDNDVVVKSEQPNVVVTTGDEPVTIKLNPRIKTEKPKRARGPKGKFKADNKSTKDVNEAWVGGKAPVKKPRGRKPKK